MVNCSIRRMGREEVRRIAEIDRSEKITLGYKWKDGRLVTEAVDWNPKRWSSDGENSEVETRARNCRMELDRGGVMLGAFDEERLAGFAVLRYHLTESLAQLAYLFVSREYRRHGIARRLVAEIRDLAESFGASGLYVSAMPSESAVGFYRSQGFEPTLEVNEELYALEPEDIHMIMPLSPKL